MIKTRLRKVLRDVWSRKGRTALVALSIMIGVFGAVTLLSVNDLVIKQIESDIRSEEIAMSRLYVTVPTAGTNVTTDSGEDQILSLLRAQIDADQPIPGTVGLTDIEGSVFVPIYWQKPGEKSFREGDLVAPSDPFDQVHIEPMRLLDDGTSRWPVSGQHELVIEKRMGEEYDLGVGDTIQFRTLGEGGTPEEWTIVGLVFHPYWIGGENDNNPKQRIYTSFEDARQITIFSGYSYYYMRYIDTKSAHDQIQTLQETIASSTSYIPVGYWLDNPDDYFLLDEVKQITNILNILAIVALVVSGFLVTNVINTIIVEQKRQIGVMKSIGATRMDNFFIYAGIALVYGIIGTIPGVIIGVIVGSLMSHSVAPLAFTSIEGFKVSTLAVIVGVVMGLAVPVIAALIPVFNGTRVTIREAMTDLGIGSKWGRGPLARLIKALPLAPSIRQALSNVVQKKGRLLLTVITLTLAVGAFMGVMAVFDRITTAIDDLYATFDYEVMVIPTEAQDFDTIRNGLKEIDGVDEVYPGVGFNVKIIDLLDTNTQIDTPATDDSDELIAFGYNPFTSIFDITYKTGAHWTTDTPAKSVVMTQSAADRFKKKVGDKVRIEAGGRSDVFTVIGTVEYPFEFVLMDWQDLSQIAGFTNPSGDPLPNAFFVTLQGGDKTSKEVTAFVDRISEKLLNMGITAELINQVEEKESQVQNINVFGMIFQITSGVMAAVGAIGLLATLSMAVFERQKEIGVMRSIGARSLTIVTQFEVEGILIGVLAWLIGLPLSYLLAVALMDALEFSEFIEFTYPVQIMLLGLGGMVVIAFIASLWPSVSASRKTVSDILRYQ